MLIGPFFFVLGRFIYNACPIDKGDVRSDKRDNPYGHERLWDDHFRRGDYIDFPRGRVIYDTVNKSAIIYIDKCIDKPAIIKKLKDIFNIDVPYTIEYDFHYQCKDCLEDIWAD